MLWLFNENVIYCIIPKNFVNYLGKVENKIVCNRFYAHCIPDRYKRGY